MKRNTITGRGLARALDLYDEGISPRQIDRALKFEAGSAYVIHRSGRSRSRGASIVARALSPQTAKGRRRAEEVRQFVALVHGEGLSLRAASTVMGLPQKTADHRYRGIYGRSLRQYVWGEDCGLPMNVSAAREYLRRQGVPRSLVAQLMGAQESIDLPRTTSGSRYEPPGPMV